ncbi:hypothetical protein RBG61_12930 [Paludicola sp. MB14-C6]|uniref:hypothetical protein n=1 Tax=Paludihabitans sp. MB14-C6 TaxID=3070656 RepID=UPI0027DE6917|nr:hypothetical protein [Paludicola sp. MB14-C6]WMJ22880.1 hypothetical protein RBG61_12930 [Paludicola sp. MB14-C6]
MSKKKRLIIIIIGLIVLSITVVLMMMFIKKPVGSAHQSSDIVSNDVSQVILPEIDKVQASSKLTDVSSKEPDIKVDGDITSKQTSSKISSSKPASKPSLTSSETSKPPVSSKPISPPTSSEETPVNPPTNPNGPQHGDTTTVFGEVAYYHIGFQTYIDQYEWAVYGKYPALTMTKDSDGYTSIINENKFVKEGAKKWWPYGKGGVGEWTYFCSHKSIWLSVDQWYCLDYPLEDFGYVDHSQPDHHKK